MKPRIQYQQPGNLDKRTPRHGTVLATGLLCLAWAFNSLAGELLGISHRVSDSGSVEISLQTDGDTPTPSVFATESPARIVLDLAGTTSAVDADAVGVGAGLVRKYTALSAGGRTRLVVDLSAPASYEVRESGSELILEVAGESYTSAAVSTAAADTQAAASGLVEVTNVDFRRGESGESRVIVSFSSPGASIAVNERGSHLFVDVFNTRVADALRKRLDVVDFATPVTYIDTDQRGSGVRLDLTVSGPYEHLAYQTGSNLVVEVKRPQQAAEAEDEPDVRFFEDKEYSGSRVSFNFQDIEVRSVLQLIADVSDLNIVVADNVAGNLTLRLTNVPWDQALDIVLDSKNLDKRQNGNVIWIAPVEDIAEREQQLLRAALEKKTLEPLETAIISLSYSKASDMQALIEESLELTNRGDEEGLLSERGSITIDERTNTLLINDTREKIEGIRALVTELDRPVRQVQIESRIVIARSDFNHELGVRFGVTHFHDGSTQFGVSGGGESATIANPGIIVAGEENDGMDVIPNGVTNRYNVNLPVSNPAGVIGLSFLNGNYLLDLELSALESEGRGEVISTPRVITANQEEAFIRQGVEIPYQQATSSGATAVQFRDAVLELRVTPLITPDNRVQMDLGISQDTVGDVFVVQNGVQIPAIDTRELSTSVLVNNGETVVLGGIYQDENNFTEDKVPGLGDLPVIGAAFRKKVTENQKRELLVFITPTILDDRPPEG